jgi:hypothetical protein
MCDEPLQVIAWLRSRIEVLEGHIDLQYIARSSMENQIESLSYENQKMRYQIYNADKSVEDQLEHYTQKSANRQRTPESTRKQEDKKIEKNHFTRSKKREREEISRVERMATLRALYNFPK